MDFITLCQTVRRESGITGEGPASVANQVGILARVVEWVRKANTEIQLERDDWSFLWATVDTSLQAGVKTYIKGDLSAPDMKSLAAVLIGRNSLLIRDWDWWTYHIRRTNLKDATGTPEAVTIDPSGNLHFYPKPDADMDITVDYFTNPVPLVENTDIPVIPENYRQTIVERALMFYADYEEDQYLFAKKELVYKEWLGRMGIEFLPKVRV